MTRPTILVRIDGNSRVSVLQGESPAAVYLLDERIDPHLVMLPEADQMAEILDAVWKYKLVSILQDDLSRTAADLNHQLRTGQIVVAGFAK